MTPLLKRLLVLLAVVSAAGGWYSVTRPKPGPGAEEYRQALMAGDGGDAENAVELLRKAVIAAPDNPEYHAELGARWMRLADHERAAAELQAAAFLQPDLPHVYCQLSQCLVELRRREDALAALEVAFKMTPDCPHALTVRGEQYLRDDNLKPALADFQRAAQLDPSSAVVHQKIGYILFQTQQFEAARAALDRGLQLAPAHPGTHLLLGQAHLKLGGSPQALETARQHLQAALLNNPEAPKAYAALGQVYLRQDNLFKAREAFESALAGQATMQDALYGLVQVASREGKPDEAARHRKSLEGSQRREQELSDLKARADANRDRPGPALRYARACLAAGALKDAGRALERVIAVNPGLREARELRAEFYDRANNAERATRERAIALGLPPAVSP